MGVLLRRLLRISGVHGVGVRWVKKDAMKVSVAAIGPVQ
ncbi:hypothetical protein ACS15_3868 [Ralstonia insidiosa]|uniref:Uncharacterized protein n=1 Tax=Ralstonia insidiosa TaxID=190721 RepID=A0AAC9FP86_9RALS|nr:hypothetical protein ACS15_3868 [Ralstonia insidiosa]